MIPCIKVNHLPSLVQCSVNLIKNNNYNLLKVYRKWQPYMSPNLKKICYEEILKKLGLLTLSTGVYEVI